jgi:hypothetical protein
MFSRSSAEQGDEQTDEARGAVWSEVSRSKKTIHKARIACIQTCFPSIAREQVNRASSRIRWRGGKESI